jgi:prefoldin beta subunit
VPKVNIYYIRIELQSYHDNLRQLTAQKSENESVKAEFEKLEADASVWKLVGPLMVKQDSVEAAANVEKRIEFITSELANVESNIKKREEDFETKRQEMIKIQTQIQSAQVVAI